MIKTVMQITLGCLVIASQFALAEGNQSYGFDPVKSPAGQPANLVQRDMTQLLKRRLGVREVSNPTETSATGIYQTRFGGKFGYLVENGRYVIIGEMIDLERGINLTDISRRAATNLAINAAPASDTVTFAARGEEKAVLNVFTDTSCFYCQKLHKEVSYLQEAGISVRYFPFPRGGRRGPGYQELKQVWCAKDRMEAMDIGKKLVEGVLPDGNCEASASVDRGFELGNELGVTGTPALFTDSGEPIAGYVPHERLIARLLNNL